MFSIFKKTLTVCTHSGSFHADEVFACATLSIWADKNGYKLKIIRSRDEKDIKSADIVVDVGSVYDPATKRFDHHQRGGAGGHENGIPYASFGLVWKHYGEQVCGSYEVSYSVESKLIMPIDARDNGINITRATELGIQDHRTSNAISDFNVSWQEDGTLQNKQFYKVLYLAKEIIKREIVWAKAGIEGAKIIKQKIIELNNPEILVLEQSVEWEEALSKNPNTKFVVYKSRSGIEWAVQSPRDDLEDYNSNRMQFPKEWQGLRGDDLVQITKVKDAVFCIKGGWMAKAKSKDGALALAKKALQEAQN